MNCFKDFLDTVEQGHPIHIKAERFKQCCEMLDYEVDSWWLRTYLVSLSSLRTEIEDMEKTAEGQEICDAFVEMLKAHHLMWSAIYKRDYGDFSDIRNNRAT